jgi:hypothetical protein
LTRHGRLAFCPSTVSFAFRASAAEDAALTLDVDLHTLGDLVGLAGGVQGKDDQFNNALFAEIKAAMPYICADSFAAAGQ